MENFRFTFHMNRDWHFALKKRFQKILMMNFLNQIYFNNVSASVMSNLQKAESKNYCNRGEPVV